jgi:hypothetical protein
MSLGRELSAEPDDAATVAELERALGETAAGETAGLGSPPLPPVLEAWPPISRVAELGSSACWTTWQDLERWLEAFVRFHTEDLQGLREVMKEPAERRTLPYDQREWPCPAHWVEAMADVVATPGPHPGGRLPDLSRVSAPHWLLLRRLAELHAAVRAGTPPPCLLATPTTGTGGLDPAELVARIERYERAGVEAMPADLQQALLRLPHRAPPEVAARAGRLTSPAGGALADWLARRPRPQTRIGWRHGSGLYRDDREPATSGVASLVPGIRAEPTGLELVDHLLSDPRPSRWQADGDDPGGWSAMMPHDREAMAAHFLPYLFCREHGSHLELAHIRTLTVTDGRPGEAVALLVAYFLLNRKGNRASSGVSLLLDLAARGDLPAVEVGRQLALLLRRTWLKPVSLRESMELAADQGGPHLWQVMTGLLPAYLPGPGERAHAAHTQALALAARIAARTGARGALPCVAEIAGRAGDSGLVREARRLHASLA